MNKTRIKEVGIKEALIQLYLSLKQNYLSFDKKEVK